MLCILMENEGMQSNAQDVKENLMPKNPTKCKGLKRKIKEYEKKKEFQGTKEFIQMPSFLQVDRLIF